MLSLNAQTTGAAEARTASHDAPSSHAWHNLCSTAYPANMQFEAMARSYAATGGIGRVEQIFVLFKQQGGPRPPLLASWIRRRQVICFEWDDGIWLPWFQFHKVDLRPHPQLDAVFTELTPVFDAWEMANWFARPNAWLADRSPVATLAADLAAVRNAARADRFIVNG